MRLVERLDDLPAAAIGLLGRDGFFSSLAWWRTVWAAGIPPGGTPLFAISGDGDGAVLFALLRHGDGRIEALTNPYTCLYQPCAGFGADLPAAGAALARLGRGAGGGGGGLEHATVPPAKSGRRRSSRARRRGGSMIVR